jgi:hypothetical protein
MADPTEQRVKEQRRADALRANLKRRKTQARAEARGRDAEPAATDAPSQRPTAGTDERSDT